MSQETLQNKFIGKPYQQNGIGNPGYDCCTLALAVLKSYGYTFPGDLKKAEEEFWRTLDKSIIQKELDTYATKIWTGIGRSFQKNNLQPGDILVYSFLRNSLHLGIYVGYNLVITMKDNTMSVGININDPIYIRMLIAHYRVK